MYGLYHLYHYLTDISFFFFHYDSPIAFGLHQHIYTTSSSLHLFSANIYQGHRHCTLLSNPQQSVISNNSQAIMSQEKTPYGAPPLDQAAPKSSSTSSSDHDIEAHPAKKPGTETRPESTPAVEVDPNIVNWDGPDDKMNPLNWPKSIRFGHVVLVSGITLIVYAFRLSWFWTSANFNHRNLASTMVAPGAGLFMADFHSDSPTLSSLSISIYLLGFALGPLLVAPLSELYGRLILYHCCNVVFLGFTIGCALSTNLGMFLVFRFLTGCAGSGPLTIGGGTVSDVIPQDQRGAAMAIFALGPLLGPVIGPVAGGFVAQNLGWRWSFWILAIVVSSAFSSWKIRFILEDFPLEESLAKGALQSGLVSILTFVVMRETNATTLLNRKVAALRKSTGNTELVSALDTGLTPAALFKRTIMRPLKLLFLSPIVLLLSIFCAVIFGLTFLLFATFSPVFEQQYGFSAGISGLAFLGLGIGMMCGVLLFSVLSDKVLKKLTKAGGGEMKAEYRLPLMVCFTPMLPIGFFWYGVSNLSYIVSSKVSN